MNNARRSVEIRYESKSRVFKENEVIVIICDTPGAMRLARYSLILFLKCLDLDFNAKTVKRGESA